MRLLPLEYAVRNLLRDPWRLLQLAGGSALVALLLLATGGFSAGMRGAMAGSGDPANTILLGAGSEGSIERSSLDPGTAAIVAASIDGLRDAAGVPAVSPEIVHMTLVEAGGATAQATLRGVTPMAFAVHRGARLAAGQLPAGDELLAGRLAHRRLGLPESALRPGAVLRLEGRDFTVSGIFAAPGTVYEGELWAPLDALMAATRRTTISTVVVARGSAEPADLEAFAAMRLDLELSAVGEAEYYADRNRFFAPIRVMAWLTALLIAGGAVFGGLNTFHAAFAARRREAATVLAIGFPRRAVLVSFLTESTLVSILGTLAALLVALLLLDGAAFSVPGGTFTLELDPASLALGLGAGLALGPLGALLPAWRCLSPPLPSALRSA
jgi:putative ABC transport system permease protein